MIITIITGSKNNNRLNSIIKKTIIKVKTINKMIQTLIPVAKNIA